MSRTVRTYGVGCLPGLPGERCVGIDHEQASPPPVRADDPRRPGRPHRRDRCLLHRPFDAANQRADPLPGRTEGARVRLRHHRGRGHCDGKWPHDPDDQGCGGSARDRTHVGTHQQLSPAAKRARKAAHAAASGSSASRKGRDSEKWTNARPNSLGRATACWSARPKGLPVTWPGTGIPRAPRRHTVVPGPSSR